MGKRISSLLIVGVIIFTMVLSGCGSSKTADQTQKSEDVGQSASADGNADQSSGASKQKVVVDFWLNKFEDYQTAWFKKWVGKFNETHDNIEVKLTVVPGDAWAQKMKAAQAAGTAPQVYTVNYSNIAPSVAQGQLMAMDDYVDPSVWADLYDNVKDFVTVKGKHYAYPQLVEPSAVLYYRKDMFESAGLDPNQPPKTWNELIEDAKKLTKGGVYGLHIANNAGEYGWTTWGMQAHSGHRAISDDWSKATLDNYYKDIIQFYKTIYDEKVAPAQALSGYTDLADFGQGKVAMAVCGSWGIGQLRNDYPNILDKVGVAVMPSVDGDATKPTATLGGWTLAIDGKAKNPKEAAEFISWLYAGDPQIMVDFFRTSKYSKFSARKSVDEALNQDEEAKNDAVRKLIAEQVVPYSVAEPIYPWDISLAFGNAIERATKGQDPQASLSQAEKEINDFIKKQNLAGTNPKQ